MIGIRLNNKCSEQHVASVHSVEQCSKIDRKLSGKSDQSNNHWKSTSLNYIGTETDGDRGICPLMIWLGDAVGNVPQYFELYLYVLYRCTSYGTCLKPPINSFVIPNIDLQLLQWMNALPRYYCWLLKCWYSSERTLFIIHTVYRHLFLYLISSINL